MTRILIVEDDEVVRDSIARTLSVYETVTVGTGAEALAVASANGIGMVILDLNLPDTDPGLKGMRLCWRLKSILGHDLPFMILSGYGVEEAREAGLIALQKPFKTEQLREVVKSLINRGTGEHHALPMAAVVRRQEAATSTEAASSSAVIETRTPVPNSLKIAILFSGVFIYGLALVLQYVGGVDAGAMEAVKGTALSILLGSPALGTALATMSTPNRKVP